MTRYIIAVVAALCVVHFSIENNLPTFVTTVQNTTVTVGQNALLACIVDNLQTYKTAWVKFPSQTILTTHQSVVAKDSRISLSYNDHRSWYLHIREVKEDDRGWYVCQIDTQPLIRQSMYLQVLVPPRIIEDGAVDELIVRELTDVRLECKAIGFPEPYVIWRRGDGNDFYYNGEKVNVVDGEILHFSRVSRLHMGAYYCIAQNGVAPTSNKKFNLIVHFPPILHVPNQLVGATSNQKVTLSCISEAYPKSINYWTKMNGEMILPSKKYEVLYKHDVYTTNMMVTIQAVHSDDYGTYTCVSINPLGNTDGVIKLYEVTSPIEYEWRSSPSSTENKTEFQEDKENQIIRLNITSEATKCRLSSWAPFLCIVSNVYRVTKQYIASKYKSFRKSKLSKAEIL